MKSFLLFAFAIRSVFGGLLHRRQASPFGACDPHDSCVQNVGLPQDYLLQAYIDCVSYLEHTTTTAVQTYFTTLSALDGSYTTTTTVDWYSLLYSIVQTRISSDFPSSTIPYQRKRIPASATACLQFHGQYSSACSCLGVYANTVVETSPVSFRESLMKSNC
jgi:hypothetical protein